MKKAKTMRKIILALMLAAATGGTVAAQEALFRKYSGKKGVTTVTVSKAMLDMMPALKAGSKSIKDMAGKLDKVSVLSSGSKDMAQAISRDARSSVERGYEKMMDVSDGGETVAIYMRKLGSRKNEYIMICADNRETVVINITGSVTLADIKGIAGK